MSSSGVNQLSQPCIYGHFVSSNAEHKSRFMKWLSKFFKGGSSSGGVSGGQQRPQFLGEESMVWRAPVRSLVRDRTKPLQRKGGPASTPESGSKSDEDFANRLEDWDSINHRIITWFSNTSIASINMQFGRFDTAKEAWDTMVQRYTLTDLANQYHILSKLHDLHQDSKQSIDDFHSHMSYLWDQLALSEPKRECNKDADQFIIHRDNMRLIQFLMAL
ncbi:hypothetical protein RJ639_025378 [Escallonia herrerae]|uniref:Uncharacterized protein n=1 Tax=Escallonia herrerae TaxID=1293975 RepID=A0AA88S2C0_9ASTE|nr:hypothetical protein RJ639_025378 [Escallonia herrerae]